MSVAGKPCNPSLHGLGPSRFGLHNIGANCVVLLQHISNLLDKAIHTLLLKTPEGTQSCLHPGSSPYIQELYTRHAVPY